MVMIAVDPGALSPPAGFERERGASVRGSMMFDDLVAAEMAGAEAAAESIEVGGAGGRGETLLEIEEVGAGGTPTERASRGVVGFHVNSNGDNGNGGQPAAAERVSPAAGGGAGGAGAPDAGTGAPGVVMTARPPLPPRSGGSLSRTNSGGGNSTGGGGNSEGSPGGGGGGSAGREPPLQAPLQAPLVQVQRVAFLSLRKAGALPPREFRTSVCNEGEIPAMALVGGEDGGLSLGNILGLITPRLLLAGGVNVAGGIRRTSA